MSVHNQSLRALVFTFLSFSVTAQEYNIPGSPVENVLQRRALNPAQAAIGALIEDVCPPARLFPSGTPGRAKGDLDDNEDLKARCDEMWSNSRAGRDIPNVLAGLQASADEEDAALGTLQTDLAGGQNNDVGNRLASLRGGAQGNVAALSLNGRPVYFGRYYDYGAPLAAGDFNSRWGTFIAGDIGLIDRDATARESGFEGERYGVTAGIDYTFDSGSVMGVAVGYAQDDYDLSANSGRLESDTYSVTGYTSYYVGPSGYVDFKLGYNRTDIDQERNVRYTIQTLNRALPGLPPIPGAFTVVNQVALSETESDELFLDVTLGNDWNFDTTVLGGYAGMYYGDSTIDGFRERMSNPTANGSGLALFIDEQSPESLLTKVGANLRFTFSSPFGDVYPYLMGEYVHEFRNDNDPITGGFIEDQNAFRFSSPLDAPDRNFFNVGVGLIAPISSESSVFFRYQTLVDYDNLSVHAIELGLKLGF